MTAHRDNGGHVRLTCDFCDRTYSSGTPMRVIQARAAARREGWSNYQGRDQCPTCFGIPWR